MRSFRSFSSFLRLALLGLAAGALHGAVLVTLSTSSNSLTSGGSATLTALVTGASDPSVTWSYSPGIGTLGAGNPPASSGQSVNNYAAPTIVTQRQTIVITATSNADKSKFATTTITLSPASITVSPATATLAAGQSQQFTATGGGAGYIWSLSPAIGSIDANGVYTAPASITNPGTVTVTAASNVDSTVFGTARVTLQSNASVSVSITPTSVTLNNGQTQQFTATVQNSDNTAVRWSIAPSTVGSIDQNGLYTAPSTITSSTSKVTVTATSAADPSKTASATINLATFTDVGTGSPNASVQQLFITAFYRAGFNFKVTLPPVGAVRRLGTTGLVQEFNDASGSSAKWALVVPDQNVTVLINPDQYLCYQLWSDLYTYYNSVGVSTAGYPTQDTQSCPTFDSANSCTWDLFSNNYALFAYKNALFTGQTFTIRNNFYTRWAALGGMSGLGRAVDGEVSVTASTGSTATVQTYASGAIYQYTNGANNGKYFAVMDPIYTLYVSSGGPGGSLGFPVGDEIILSTGVHRQTFQNGGSLEYTPGSDPGIRLPVSSVNLTGTNGNAGGTLKMNVGDTAKVVATPVAPTGDVLTGRVVSWTTSNSRVVTVTATNENAVLTAVGGGVAVITASSEGVVSPRLTVTVTAPCCAIGETAPANVQQAFQDAITRNKLSVLLPAQSPALRVANGYTQMLQASSGTAVYMVAKSDRLGTAYIVTGDLLKAYQQLGGAGGSLGYPSSDATAGGRQLFENNAALAGTPVRAVTGAILTKWASLGYETGVAGSPLADPVAFSTFGANSGSSQGFSGGSIYAASAGPRAGQAYFVSGLILARYTALAGPGGTMGMPVSDEFVNGSTHTQSFEGGTIDYATGDTVAKDHAAAKAPAIVATPSSAVAGSRVRLAVVGFPAQSTIRVSLSGQPDFLVTTDTGAYAWDAFIPLTAKSGSLTIQAVDTLGTTSVSLTVPIKGLAENRVQINKVQGDNQTGLPGALASKSLRIALVDSSGAVVVGAPVTFQASPGAQLTATTGVTDQNGQAETFVRLPTTEGIALVTADSPGIAQQSVTFGLRVVSGSLANFPQMLAAGTNLVGNGQAPLSKKGALLAAAASILRYHQNAGTLPSPNGLADPAALNTFLQRFCATSAAGNDVCDGFISNPDGGDQVANLWRAGEFTGGGVDPVAGAAATSAILDWLGQGSPVLVSLAVSLNGTAAGGHTVVATGVAADGSIVIQDPSPQAARTNLSDYLNGFSLNATQVKADLRGVLRFVLRTPSSSRFLMAAPSQSATSWQSLAFDIRSSSGVCGTAFDTLDAADMTGPAAVNPLITRMQSCDGTESAYQVSVGAGQPFRTTVTDLATGGARFDLSGSAAAAYQAARNSGRLALTPLTVSFTASSVVSAADFASGLAPGTLAAIFGTGLTGAKGNTTVELDGSALRVVSSNTFQINAEIPVTTAAGVHSLRVRSDYGVLEQSVQVRDVAPAIFLAGDVTRGIVANQDGTLNSASNPATRGKVLVVYATGLGAVSQSGSVSVTTAAVTAILNGQELPVAFSGLAPGYIGVYQVNVPLPAAVPPGLDQTFSLKVGDSRSNAVSVSIQ